MNKKLLELYSDYIISSFGQITATGLSKALSGEITHDKVTRFLSREEFDSKKLWKLVKPVVREQEKEEGVIIVDDTIEQKPYTEESELVCWHHDHKSNRAVKGINLVNYIYSTGEVNIPIGFDVVRKPIEFCSLKTQKRKRKATITKNELTRNHLKICQQNQIKYRYVLAQPRMGQTAARRLGGVASALVCLQRKHDLDQTTVEKAFHHGSQE